VSGEWYANVRTLALGANLVDARRCPADALAAGACARVQRAHKLKLGGAQRHGDTALRHKDLRVSLHFGARTKLTEVSRFIEFPRVGNLGWSCSHLCNRWKGPVSAMLNVTIAIARAGMCRRCGARRSFRRCWRPKFAPAAHRELRPPNRWARVSEPARATLRLQGAPHPDVLPLAGCWPYLSRSPLGQKPKVRAKGGMAGGRRAKLEDRPARSALRRSSATL
jgi:hypothetical protein